MGDDDSAFDDSLCTSALLENICQAENEYFNERCTNNSGSESKKINKILSKPQAISISKEINENSDNSTNEDKHSNSLSNSSTPINKPLRFSHRIKQKNEEAVIITSNEINPNFKDQQKLSRMTKTVRGCHVSPSTNEGYRQKNSIIGMEKRVVTTSIENTLVVSSVDISRRTSGERSIMDNLSMLSTQEKVLLSSWGLPEEVLKKYSAAGITKMFPWQVECLCKDGVLEGRNLVFSAPTSAGKTLVAEFILLKRVLETGRKGMFILPFVSVAREKTLYLQALFGAAGVRVEGFMGSQAPPRGFESTDIAICTIEKANNLINRLMEEDKINKLGIVVVDELHMVGDLHRGYLLELMLTKLRYLSMKQESTVQIIGMSATLPNLDVLAKWLDAELYSTTFRPIPLVEMVKIGTVVYNEKFSKLRDLTGTVSVKGDSDHLVQLCLETLLEGFSVLIFCPAKAWCEKVAVLVAGSFYQIGKQGSSYPTKMAEGLRKRLDASALGRILEALKKCPAGLDSVLSQSIAFGAAFHHAGLTFDERDIIEGAFRSGYLPVLAATSTLSSGVNLPARRVIIRSPNTGGNLLDIQAYKQMIGRAGRLGKDTQGESILMCATNERFKAERLVKSDMPPIASCMQTKSSATSGASSSMKRAILEVIVGGAAKSYEEIQRYCNCSLLVCSLSETSAKGSQNSTINIEDCLKYLLENEFIRCQKKDGESIYGSTQLGSAVLASGLSPDDGLHVYSELYRARHCFVLQNELHVVYQVTPIYVSDSWPNLDWLIYLELWEKLPQDMKRVGELVGVEESFIIRAMKGMINKTSKHQRQTAVHQRFFASLALLDLVKEMPLRSVVVKYNATKGLLQALQQSASTFAGMVTVFCNRLGWNNIELLISQYQDRLQFGIQRDLCDLVRITLLNGDRARILFNSGFETVAKIANAGFQELEAILRSSTPFLCIKDELDGIGLIWGPTGVPLKLSEASKGIILQAQAIMEKEIGINNIDWNQKKVGVTSENEPNVLNISLNQTKKRSSTEITLPPQSKYSKTAADNIESIEDTNNNNNLPRPVDTTNNKSTVCNSSLSQEQKLVTENIDNKSLKSNSTFIFGKNRKKPTNAPVSEEYGSNNLPLSTQLKTKDVAKLSNTLSISNLGVPGINSRSRNSMGSDDLFDVSGNSQMTPQKKDTSNIQIETPVYAACAEKLDFSFDLDQNSGSLDLDQKSESLDLDQNSESLNLDQDRVSIDEDVHDIATESGMLSVTRESIESDMNVSVKAHDTKPLHDETLSDSFLDRAFDTYYHKDTFAEDTVVAPVPQLTQCLMVKENTFEFSTLLLSPNTEALLDGLETGRKLEEKEGLTEKDVINISNRNQITAAGKESVKQEQKCDSALSFETDKFKLNNSVNTIIKDDSYHLTQSLCIIDVTSDKCLFKTFLEDLSKQKIFSVSLACESAPTEAKKGIGWRVCGRTSRQRRASQKPITGLVVEKSSLLLIGVAICWGDRDAYYINLRTVQEEAFNSTFPTPPTSSEVPLEERINSLQRILSDTHYIATRIWDAKTTLTTLVRSGLAVLESPIEDPTVASWMLDPTAKPKNLHHMVMSHAESFKDLLVDIGSATGLGSIGMCPQSGSSSRVKAATESVLVFHLMDTLLPKLEELGMLKSYRAVEMPCISSIARMELNGMGFNNSLFEEQKKMLLRRQKNLEQLAYQYAGRSFSMASPDDVARVIYQELHLSDPRERIKGVSARGRPSRGAKCRSGPTNKEALEKLKSCHPLPEVILEWRKINSALTKIILPMQQVRKPCSTLNMDRIYPVCQTFTATGRVSVHEPNLQNVPRDFEVCLPEDDEEEGLLSRSKRTFNRAQFSPAMQQLAPLCEESYNHTVCLRDAFVAGNGRVLLSADYSQLELRILSHFTGDMGLISALNSPQDAFVTFAAQMRKIPEDEVTPALRQQAKQICYGIIYGMGTKSLSEQLSVSEEDASALIRNFYGKYPGIPKFIKKTIDDAASNGYVTTLLGRRRYFEGIKSDSSHIKAQCERQAVNTRIQGSASDLVKSATVNIEDTLRQQFPSMSPLLTRLNGRNVAEGAYLVLQLHDELIYEVAVDDVIQVAQIVKYNMERAAVLATHLRVKVKVGTTWGDMRPLLDSVFY